MDGSNKRGRPHREWSDDIEQWCGTTLQELSHAALDGQRWAAIVRMASDTNGHWAHGCRWWWWWWWRPPIVRWQKFAQKPLGGADIGGQNLNFGPDFLKTGELCPHILALLEGTHKGLQATQSIWAKVQKQKSYKRSNFENNSNFLEISELKCLISRERFGVLT